MCSRPTPEEDHHLTVHFLGEQGTVSNLKTTVCLGNIPFFGSSRFTFLIMLFYCHY